MEVIAVLLLLYIIRPKVQFLFSLLIELIYTLKFHSKIYEDATEEAEKFRCLAMARLEKTNKWW